MPSERRTLLADRVLRLITSEWMHVDDLMEKAIPLVPPGKAQREYQNHARRNDKARQERIDAGETTLARRPVPSVAEQEAQGARGIINGIIGSYKDRHVIDVEYGATRFDRRVRLSQERAYAHHCCLHGGSCRGEATDEPAAPTGPAEGVVAPTPSDPDTYPIPDDNPLWDLITRVLASRERRLAGPPPEPKSMVDLREVVPGSIDRLLESCR